MPLLSDPWKILLTGKTGQIGGELQKTLSPLGDLIATDRNELDLADHDQIRQAVRQIQPNVIVNAAAYTQVDKAEEEKKIAKAINEEGPAVLADEAKKLGALLVHYSTDYIFDGKNDGRPYSEEDQPNPSNAYGQTKLAGERAINNSGAMNFIFRSGWVYGLRGQNFLLTMQQLMSEREEIKIVNDQTGAPTWSRLIAEGTFKVLQRIKEKSSSGDLSSVEILCGIYNMTCGGQTSWHGFAEAILKASDLNVRPNLVGIPTEEYPTPAVRPKNATLSNTKLKKTFGVELPDWETALKLCLG